MLLLKQKLGVFGTLLLELVVGGAFLAMAAAGGAIQHVSSSSLAILILFSFFYVHTWSSTWHRITDMERKVLFCFALYFFSAVLAYWNVDDTHGYVKVLDRYFRFLLIIPVYLLISRLNIKLFPYLLIGAIISGPLYLGIALSALYGDRFFSGYHHITFGDMAMLNAIFMAATLVMKELRTSVKAILIISIICVFYASVLSEARGAWLALPFCLLILLYISIRQNRMKIQTIVFAVIVLTLLVALSPAKDIIVSRMGEAIIDVDLFYKGVAYHTSIGNRLAMWDVAIDVWSNHMILGTGPGDFGMELEASKELGLYQKLPPYDSAHNIYIHALATTGIVGFVVLCLALFIMPFRLFYFSYKKYTSVVSVSGMIVLTAFVIFGLSESWMLRAPVVSVYLLYFVALGNAASEKLAVGRKR